MAEHHGKPFAEENESTFKDLESPRVEYMAAATGIASKEANEEEIVIHVNNDIQKLYKIGLYELVERKVGFKKDSGNQLIKNLEAQLCETFSKAKESLYKVGEEEKLLRSLVRTLKVKLKNMKNEHYELNEKLAETDSAASNLHMKLRKAKYVLEEALAEEAKARVASDEKIGTIRQLLLECENAKQEAKKMKQQTEELRREAKATRIELKEAEKRLRVTVIEAEEAKAAEVKAADRVHILSKKTDAARLLSSGSEAWITVSRDEYESLSRKAEECGKLAELKVAAIMARVEAVRVSEDEAVKRLEAIGKEIEGMRDKMESAFKKAEMARAAQKAVEGELRRWRENEQKKVAEEASRAFVGREESFDSSPLCLDVEKQVLHESIVEKGKVEKVKSCGAKKVMRLSIRGVFCKKKNQVKG